MQIIRFNKQRFFESKFEDIRLIIMKKNEKKVIKILRETL